MADSKIPSLGYARLGLLQKPSSGYDLRKVFSSTSMKTYSDRGRLGNAGKSSI
ncbi:MAG TPA: hypothetical protein VNO32_29630 [Candidatus Acidoferrum sp.]|nr:hypothetical protein [Candidatus Acidoferrum sp.]